MIFITTGLSKINLLPNFISPIPCSFR